MIITLRLSLHGVSWDPQLSLGKWIEHLQVDLFLLDLVIIIVLDQEVSGTKLYWIRLDEVSCTQVAWSVEVRLIWTDFALRVIEPHSGLLALPVTGMAAIEAARMNLGKLAQQVISQRPKD